MCAKPVCIKLVPTPVRANTKVIFLAQPDRFFRYAGVLGADDRKADLGLYYKPVRGQKDDQVWYHS